MRRRRLLRRARCALVQRRQQHFLATYTRYLSQRHLQRDEVTASVRRPRRTRCPLIPVRRPGLATRLHRRLDQFWNEPLVLPPTWRKLQNSFTEETVQALFDYLDPLDWYDTMQLVQNSLFAGSRAVDVGMCFRAEAQVLRELGATRAANALGRGAYNATNGSNRHEMPIVIDTGCSVSLTPFLEDFITEIGPSQVSEMLGIADSVAVKGEGRVEWKVRDVWGRKIVVRTTALYVPKATIRLFSPQYYLQEADGGELTLTKEKATFTSVDGSVGEFPYQDGSNLPFMLEHQCICQAGLSSKCVLNLTTTDSIELAQGLLRENNANLSGPQKELMLWHYRLAHAGQALLQSLMMSPKADVGVPSEPPLIPTKLTGTPRCAQVKCPACQLARQTRRTPDSFTTSNNPEREMAIRRKNMQPGDCVSMDQYESPVRGRLSHTFGKENPNHQYRGGTILCDHSSGFIQAHHQTSLGMGETLQGKHAFESFARQFGIKIKAYHADNAPFDSQAMHADIETQGQTLTFSGVGAHFQNGVAERAIQTITTSARAMMMHMLINWPGAFSADLWPFAMDQAVALWNHLPRSRSGLSPIELFTGTRLPDSNVVQRARVWGCPVFVLDPKLQDGNKLPKWDRRSHLGVYLGSSPAHASTVGLILNPKTGYISPQYHVVYDELFSAVPGGLSGEAFDQVFWNNLLALGGHEKTLDPDDAQGETLPFSEFFDDFHDSDSDSDDESSAPLTASEGDRVEDEASEGEPVYRTRSGRPVRNNPRFAGTYYGHRPGQTRRNQPHYRQLTYEAGGILTQRVPRKALHNSLLHGLNWETTLESLKSPHARKTLFGMLTSLDPNLGTLEEWNPLALAAKMYDDDNPSWEMAMNGPNADGFWKAAETELNTLQSMGVWDVVEREQWMNVLPSTWAFKVKRFPTGDVRKLKARFCARGDRQIQGVDFFETYAPVVNWTTVRLLLILTAQLGLATQQVDYTAAFVHADIDLPPDFDKMSPEEQRRQGVFVEMPRGFGQPGMVLKLKKSLYGLRQSPKNWFNFLKSKLEAVGLVPATHIDPCLFISKDNKVICLVYVDDTLFYAQDDKEIDNILDKLRNQEGMTLERENDVAGFLGVQMTRDSAKGTITLTQKGLAERIVEALHCQDLPPVDTPAIEVLGKDEQGDPADCAFNYASVIGMLWYLYGHSRPDLGFAVSQAARFAFQPKRCHELALIRIGQYLKGTMNRGLTMKPMDCSGFQLDAYVDSDFMGLYGKEDRRDPTNVKSRTGFVICLNGCPIVWASKLQQSIALSTMMAEYYALSTCMQEVIPLRNVIKAVAEGLDINQDCVASFRTTVWEDNMGALTLANLEPGQSTPRSKFYDVKVHWFRDHLEPGVLEVEKIDTLEQLADLFTKPLVRELFVRLRLKLMGW